MTFHCCYEAALRHIPSSLGPHSGPRNIDMHHNPTAMLHGWHSSCSTRMPFPRLQRRSRTAPLTTVLYPWSLIFEGPVFVLLIPFYSIYFNNLIRFEANRLFYGVVAVEGKKCVRFFVSPRKTVYRTGHGEVAVSRASMIATSRPIIVQPQFCMPETTTARFMSLS